MLAVLTLLRGLHLLCLVSLLGTLTVRLIVAPSFEVVCAELVRLARVSLLLAVPTLLLWLLLQTAVFADAVTIDRTVETLPVVLLHTRFGHVLVVRIILLAATWPLIGRGRMAWIAAAGLVAVALALQADLGHAGAAGAGTGAGLLASEGLHVVAAGAWLGGLVPLLVMTARLPRPLAAVAARRFAAVGLPAVVVLIATALVQGDALIGGLPGLFGTDYGHVALVKLGLFSALLALALLNRFTLTARFEQGRAGRRALVAAIGIEALAGVGVVMAAAALASQEPGVHAEAVWPFSLRPSTVALQDPNIRWEVTAALIGIVAGLLLTIAGLACRRLGLLIVGLVSLAFALQHLRPLLVEAFPTSYLDSPTGFGAASIMRGATVFADNCADCHGSAGRGDGIEAKALNVPPADLTGPHLRDHRDGELFWWLTHGVDSRGGGLSMPGFGTSLSDADRWAAIDFIRADNAGIALRKTGAWPMPMQAPSVPLTCGDGTQADMATMRGRVVMVLAAAPLTVQASARIEPSLGFGLATVVLANPVQAPQSGIGKSADVCLAATPEAWPAYAILTGVASNAFAGSVILIDPAGRLRSVIRTDGETNPVSLVLPLLTEIARHPVFVSTGDMHVHH